MFGRVGVWSRWCSVALVFDRIIVRWFDYQFNCRATQTLIAAMGVGVCALHRLVRRKDGSTVGTFRG
jgi:hypothetical protein